MRLPMFPLNVTVVPGLALPLHIFEPRYRALVEELLAQPESDGREFGIIASRAGRTFDTHGPAALYEVGVAARLAEVELLPDGRYNIMTSGTRRFRLQTLDDSESLLRADVEFLPDRPGAEDASLASGVRRQFTRYRELLGARRVLTSETSAEDLPLEPATLSYLVTASLVVPANERQDLLAAATIAERLIMACRLLNRECALIEALASLPMTDPVQFLPSPN